VTGAQAGRAGFQARALITGIGGYSPVGYNGPATFAALRAGITRLNELRDVVDRHGEPLAAARIPGIAFAPGQADRVASIGISVLREVIVPLSTQEQRLVRVSLVLGEAVRVGPVSRIVEQVGSALGEMGLATPVALDVYPEGNAGGVKALQTIQSRLHLNPASIEIVAGADSLSNVHSVAFFEKHHRLRESTQPRGLHLGEAGASLVLRSERAVLSGSTPRYAAITGSGVSMETVPYGRRMT
jgi:3-oxoacyl-[acyl-carrier-protein] synthase-1